MHKTNFQFPVKYDIKSFEHTTVLTSAPQNVHQHTQNHVKCLHVEPFVFIFGQHRNATSWWIIYAGKEATEETMRFWR